LKPTDWKELSDLLRSKGINVVAVDFPLSHRFIKEISHVRPRHFQVGRAGTFSMTATGYGTSILPARPRHPQDKAKAESAVQVVERWIMARLRHQQFGSVHEFNQVITPLLTRLNEKLFQKLPGSRASTFAEIDAPALLPLPLQRYEMAHFKTVKVHIDYHVDVERHRYSVPHSLVGQVLEARVTTAVVELMHRGQRQPSSQQPARRLHHVGK
jgi:transposase